MGRGPTLMFVLERAPPLRLVSKSARACLPLLSVPHAPSTRTITPRGAARAAGVGRRTWRW